jgi:peptidoglycan/xylan/chitin deacetylase (PgdA/CDA1 family)
MKGTRNKLYYQIKPFLPARFRMMFRRWFALRKRISNTHVWPVYPGSETSPSGWKGWPGDMKFAVVITHDVEGVRGLERCRPLLQIDQSLGFRSSFNFVPEGEYNTPDDLRHFIASEGFEVGLHDLHHDGKLFNSREGFRKYAEEINQYLETWKVDGFRAGFMMNQPDWLHDLNIRYDASNFDTDPFEPEPKGCHTIYPFWVENTATDKVFEMSSLRESRPSSDKDLGYVELPYTLPQDSTLFVLFKETDPSIWLEKVDWIAKHGGMVLVNVHPDYIQFKNDTASWRTYSYKQYVTLLQHISQSYAGQYWQPLPREMAGFIRGLVFDPTLARDKTTTS